MDWSEKHSQQIYEKAIIKRSQAEKNIIERSRKAMEANFWEYLHTRLSNVLKGILELESDPNTARGAIDAMKKDFSKLLHTVEVCTMPEVINQLTMELMKEKQIMILEKQ